MNIKCIVSGPQVGLVAVNMIGDPLDGSGDGDYVRTISCSVAYLQYLPLIINFYIIQHRIELGV